ncbi:MAG: hypothetical protein KBG70_10710 [Chitinophagales bacterium]|jgi:alpha-1,6-mannosyltransferase|nr:hypothetical protein [Chitinophagales bacterium]
MIKTAITGTWRFAVYLLMVAVFVLIGYFTSREDFLQLFVLYSAAFGLYLVLLKYADTNDLVKEGRYLGIFLRFVLLFSIPNLTDDFYRFIWDGKLLLNGINPYAFSPEQITLNNVHHTNFTNVVDTHLFNELNSKQYFSIYPPVCQFLFSGAAFLSFNNTYVNIVLLKFFIFLFEAGTILLLPKLLVQLKMPVKYQLIYTLNPLIILELTGNMHFEAIMVFFLVLSIYYLVKQKDIFSAIAFGFAIGSKLWPVMLLPLFFKFIGFKRTLQFCLISGVVALIILLPMFLQYKNIAGSLNLYFQQFEFNASSYYFFRFIIGKDANYDTFLLMRKLLPLFTVIGITLLSIFYKKQYFLTALLLAFSLYCLFATTIHPWYLSPLIILSVFSNFRYAIIWSFLIYLSYITYITPAYIENYYLIVLEYVVVIGYFVFELLVKKKVKFSIQSR